MLAYTKTPVEEIKDEMLVKAGVNLLIKREDLNHPYVSGNKWWKLKYNLQQALLTDHKTILTFGGAFSNHIYATAAACKELKLKSIGIIRGERVMPLNPTLKFAAECGMELQFISRSDYRRKNDNEFLTSLKSDFGDFFLVPEGGANEFAIQGCKEFAETELSEVKFDILFLPVGTGGTAAGILSGFPLAKKVIGVSVLKDGGFLFDDIKTATQGLSGNSRSNFELLTSYHHGGYAKVTPELREFIMMMKEKHGLHLDPIYTAKMMWAVWKEIELGHFDQGSTILALHTGGLQGGASLLRE